VLQPEGERLREMQYPAEPRIVPDVRAELDRFIRPLGFSPDDAEALKVALSEALANAVCHGSPQGARNRVYVRFAADGSRLLIDVRDEGTGFLPTNFDLPASDRYQPSGRGLFLMQTLMDEIRYEPASRGTRVQLIKRLPRRGAEQS